MKSSSWLKSLRNRLIGRDDRSPIHHTTRLRLEFLEDRAVPSASPLPAAYGQLPLAFEANQRQTATQVDFLARGSGYVLSLAPSEAVLALRQGTGGEVLRLQFVGANPSAQAVGREELVTTTNYLLGSDPSQWKTGIPNYGKVEYQDVYPGVNLLYYGNQGQLEYDFVVDPGIDPGVIAISVQGAQAVTLDAHGNLVLHATGGDLVQQAPVIYQEHDGQRRSVAGAFVLTGENGVGFRVGTYDTSLPLIIDPVLSYSTYLGGSGNDRANAIAVDADGNAFITGETYSANFPTTLGALQRPFGGATDAFVAKLNATGTGLIYATYLGGTNDDAGKGIALDAAGNAYVTGYTSSANFPVSADAFQRTNSAGFYKGFVAKLNSTGSALLYSTYLGGSGGFDQSRAIAVDGTGNAYVTGDTKSSDFPTQNPVQPNYFDGGFGKSDAFVTKLNATGTALVYSTFLGGSYDDAGNGIAVDSAGNAYVTGYTENTHPDPFLGLSAFPTTVGAYQQTNATPIGNGVPFVTKLNAAGSALAYSTLLGGTTGYNDGAAGIAVDSAGNAYVTGSTQAADFPTTAGAAQRTRGGLTDAFVTALNPSGSTLVYSTFLGGSNSDHGLGIAVNAAGMASITGLTESANFPTVNAVQPVFGGGYDVFVTKLNATGTALAYSTFLGGSGGDSGNGIALDSAGNAYVAGNTASTNFPTTPGVVQPSVTGTDDNAFIVRITSTTTPTFAFSGFPSSNTAGVAGSFTVVARDADGNVLTGYTGTVHFTSSDSQALLPADYTFTAADGGTRTFSATLKTAGNQSITVTDVATATFTGTQAGITVKAAAASTFGVAGFPTPTTAGVARTFTVTARDAFGNTVTGYTRTVRFTSSDLQAVLPGNYTFTASDAGVHTFSATLKTAGSQSLTATDTLAASVTGLQSGITINPAAASKFIISAPSSVSVGVAFSLTVKVVDAYGNVATGYTGTIRFTSSDGTASLPANYTFTAADNGVHTFTGLILRKKGKQTITITDTLNSSLTGSVIENVLWGP